MWLQRAQSLECLRRRQGLRQARRPPGADQCRGHAQAAKYGCGPGTPLQGRCHTGKVAAAQITTQQAQRQGRQTGAQANPQGTTHQSECGGFQQHQL